MAYNPNIPQPNDIKSISQAQILENFGQINATFSVDHETFSSPNGQGKHKQVTFPINAAVNPGPGELRIYANNSTTGNPELFLRRNGVANATPMTSANKSTQGYTMTPAGILIKWGSETIASAGGGPFAFIWPTVGNYIQFATQYWAIVQVGSDIPANPNKDVNAIAYVTDITNPLEVEYRVWRRNQFGTAGTDQQPFTVWVLAFGTP